MAGVLAWHSGFGVAVLAVDMQRRVHGSICWHDGSVGDGKGHGVSAKGWHGNGSGRVWNDDEEGGVEGKNSSAREGKEHVREKTDLPDSLKTDCVPYFLGHRGE